MKLKFEKVEIDLEKPYSSKWEQGFLFINDEGEEILNLWNGKHKSSVKYSRYLLSVHLGRFLKNTEVVTHIDGDRKNNDISNLKLRLSKFHKKPDFELDCPICGKHYSLPRNKVKDECVKQKVETNTRCCSKECAIQFKRKDIREKILQKRLPR